MSWTFGPSAGTGTRVSGDDRPPVPDEGAPGLQPGWGVTMLLVLATVTIVGWRIVQTGFMALDCEKELVTRERELFNAALGMAAAGAVTIAALIRAFRRHRRRWPWVPVLGAHVWLTIEQIQYINDCVNW